MDCGVRGKKNNPMDRRQKNSREFFRINAFIVDVIMIKIPQDVYKLKSGGVSLPEC